MPGGIRSDPTGGGYFGALGGVTLTASPGRRSALGLIITALVDERAAEAARISCGGALALGGTGEGGEGALGLAA